MTADDWYMLYMNVYPIYDNLLLVASSFEYPLEPVLKLKFSLIARRVGSQLYSVVVSLATQHRIIIEALFIP